MRNHKIPCLEAVLCLGAVFETWGLPSFALASLIAGFIMTFIPSWFVAATVKIIDIYLQVRGEAERWAVELLLFL